MDSVHINLQKIQLLDERIRNGKKYSKLRFFYFLVTNISASGPQEEEKVTPEKPKSLPKGFLVTNIPVEGNFIPKEDSNKENQQNSKIFINLESSEKIEDLPINEKGTSKEEDFNLNPINEFSIESVDLRGNRSLKKRKHEKFEQNTEKTAENFEMITKKIKLSPNQLPSMDNTNIERITKDSLGSSAGQDPMFLNKENIALGTKKITEFFKPREVTTASTSTQKPVTRSATKKITKGKGLSEKKLEGILESKPSKEFDNDDKKELYLKIKELEDKVEVNKKEREKDQIKLDNEIKAVQEEFSDYRSRVQKMSAKHVLEIENYKRTERKAILSRQRQRLGEYVSQRYEELLSMQLILN